MTSNSNLAYPAEYYYPEFIDNRPEDPRKSPPKALQLTESIDNGIGVTKIPITTITPRKIVKNKPSTTKNVPLDIITDQGLPDADITKSVRTDPKKNLLRDPAEKNIPRLIVDSNLIQQTVRTPRRPVTNLDNDFNGQGYNYNQLNNDNKTLTNGHVNGDLTKKQKIKYVEEEPPIDDYWKKEVHINDEGVVTIEVRYVFFYIGIRKKFIH